MKTENLENFATFQDAEKAALTHLKTKRVDFEPFRQDDGSHIYQFFDIDNPTSEELFECTIEGQ